MTWWREAVGYHVYLRSYKDSDGDGVGDLPGLLEKLEHPHSLGVDALWISPFYPSPQADLGYDITDHRAVDPRFGTLSDVDKVLAAAKALGMRVVADVVPNHTSDEHPWFKAALAGGPERARYHFRTEPNAWESVFGGSAWTRAPDGQWYLHLFAPQQPDLNWTNHEVAEDFDETLRFWLDRGFAGIRVDVAGGLAKDPDYADEGEIHPHWDRPETAAIHRRWRAILDSYGDRVAIGELWGPPERIAQRVRPGQLHQVFQFDWAVAPWSKLRETAANAIEAVKEPTWVLGSHDLTRVATRYGLRRATAKALITFALPGSVWIYQGDELGLADVPITADDPGGRDGVRVPMPWDHGPSYGFSPTGRAWLRQPEGWPTVADQPPILSIYQTAIKLRKQHLIGQPFEWLPADGTMAFRRGEVTCVLNLGPEPIPFDGRPLVASGPVTDLLPPDTAVWTVGTSTSAASLNGDSTPG